MRNDEGRQAPLRGGQAGREGPGCWDRIRLLTLELRVPPPRLDPPSPVAAALNRVRPMVKKIHGHLSLVRPDLQFHQKEFFGAAVPIVFVKPLTTPPIAPFPHQTPANPPGNCRSVSAWKEARISPNICDKQASRTRGAITCLAQQHPTGCRPSELSSPNPPPLQRAGTGVVEAISSNASPAVGIQGGPRLPAFPPEPDAYRRAPTNGFSLLKQLQRISGQRHSTTALLTFSHLHHSSRLARA